MRSQSQVRKDRRTRARRRASHIYYYGCDLYSGAAGRRADRRSAGRGPGATAGTRVPHHTPAPARSAALWIAVYINKEKFISALEPRAALPAVHTYQGVLTCCGARDHLHAPIPQFPGELVVIGLWVGTAVRPAALGAIWRAVLTVIAPVL